MFKEQCKLVDNYINFYERDFMGAQQYLKQYWSKDSIIEFILGKDMYREIPNFTINEDRGRINYSIEKLIDESSFISQYVAAVYNYSLEHSDFEQSKNLLYSFIEKDNLIRNITEFKGNICIDKTVIQIKQGMRIMRILRKVAEALQLDMKKFEDFRKYHAQILSTKTLTGTLCLSALPMDYLTLSDNCSNWTSCYNWHKTGIYHSSTLAFLSSSNTIVAYLKSDKKYMWGGDGAWNDKIWRQLIYIDSDFIIPGKAYPYENITLTKKIVQWIVSLLPQTKNNFIEVKATYKNEKIYLENNPIIINVSNHYSYNDFNEDFILYARQAFYNTQYQQIIFDGKTHCLKCGKVIEHNIKKPFSLRVCEDCQPPIFCNYCEGIIYPEELYIEEKKNYYHCDCYCEYKD